VLHNNVVGNFYQFVGLGLSKRHNLVWKSIWTTVMSETLSHKNKVVFKNDICDGKEIFSITQLKKVGLDH